MFGIVAAHLGQMTRKHKSLPPLSFTGLLNPSSANETTTHLHLHCSHNVTNTRLEKPYWILK